MEGSDEVQALERMREGDPAALDQLLSEHRERLARMIRLRMDVRIRGRVDPSDVIQEAFVDVAKRLPEYCKEPKLPFFLWLRLLVGQKLALAHRQHLGVKARDVGREVSIFGNRMPEASSAALAARLVGRVSSPSQKVARAELKLRIQEALNELAPLDREVLTLRHFEQLSNQETAMVLDIKPTAACNRYIRALERLKRVLGDSILPP